LICDYATDHGVRLNITKTLLRDFDRTLHPFCVDSGCRHLITFRGQ
jgi:hypothetical protein